MPHCTEPFFITLPLSLYDLNNVERDVNYQIIAVISEFCCVAMQKKSSWVIYSHIQEFMADTSTV